MRSKQARRVCLFFLLFIALTFNLRLLAASADEFHVPVEYYKLPNGLRVVLSPDHTAPTVCVGVYYRIGFRIEPKDRTGFAHLFEHMMFQGSANLGKMEFIKLIQSNGGILNGSTRFDFTNYFEVVPSNKLETILWAEADRMSGLAVTEDNLKNQQGVVGNEVKVNVLNRPYGGFPWIDLPMAANTNWYNAHNFYGDLSDIESAKLDEVKKFFDTYYAPNNAALAIVGDFEPADAKKFVEKYFGSIKPSQLPPQPDLTEPRQEKEKVITKTDPLAPRPALAIAYHMPDRNTPEYYAMGLIEQMLIEGNDSLLYKELVQKRGLTDSIEGGINLLGNMFDYAGPMLLSADVRYDPTTTSDTILAAMDTAINPLLEKPVDKQLLDRARVKARSSLYDTMTQFGGFGLMDLLSSFALFDDDPSHVNSIVPEFDKVTPELIQKTAQEYLRKTNRTVVIVQPAPKNTAAAPAQKP
ncbi:insulinase family protein [Alloacidobacterium dinghuense]|uniref:Insulinase family protein n=1 Tax=Alloacidobacterium dinghuense TaxID=2763107 RepID=A0A7G8BKB6_9BACT|nr:pitrilysin family protein [Alloacidobacterium dinghuense]QNI32986.1 insulinase family protein [Alloacidobacterium dinghuense]